MSGTPEQQPLPGQDNKPPDLEELFYDLDKKAENRVAHMLMVKGGMNATRSATNEQCPVDNSDWFDS